MQNLSCGAVWGGTEDLDEDVASAGVIASVYARSADGGRGGDIYYLSVCEGDFLTRIAVADVVGHGSRVNAVSDQLYRELLRFMNNDDGRGILVDLNRWANQQGMQAMTTAVVVGYYRPDGTLRHASAGHPEIFVQSGRHALWKGQHLEPQKDSTEPSDLPLAVFEDTIYHEVEVPLKPEDRICIVTDGLLEGPAKDEERFGAARLQSLLNEHRNLEITELKKRIVAEYEAFTGERSSHDDVTIVVAEIRA